jgi:hypothetical protein
LRLPVPADIMADLVSIMLLVIIMCRIITIIIVITADGESLPRHLELLQ